MAFDRNQIVRCTGVWVTTSERNWSTACGVMSCKTCNIQWTNRISRQNQQCDYNMQFQIRRTEGMRWATALVNKLRMSHNNCRTSVFPQGKMRHPLASVDLSRNTKSTVQRAQNQQPLTFLKKTLCLLLHKSIIPCNMITSMGDAVAAQRWGILNQKLSHLFLLLKGWWSQYCCC